MPTPVPTPRSHLADLLAAADPEAPTVCEGWNARDLTVHLLVREGRPDAAIGHLADGRTGVLAALSGHTRRVETALSNRPFDELVAQFRAGPPRWSPFAVPALERAGNEVEFYIHGEDVRRGSGSWDPVPTDPQVRASLWTALRRQAWLMLRRSPVGVVLVVPDGPRTLAVRPRTRAAGGASAGESVVLVGQSEELLLHVCGRERIAEVEIQGSDAAVTAFRAARQAR